MVQPWSHSANVIRKNLSVAKSQLSHLVSSALEGEDVVICKGGVPAVRLVPVRPASGEDPCRPIPGLVISVGDEALEPLDPEDWGTLEDGGE
jgi:prevent-host-death family protein